MLERLKEQKGPATPDDEQMKEATSIPNCEKLTGEGGYFLGPIIPDWPLALLECSCCLAETLDSKLSVKLLKTLLLLLQLSAPLIQLRSNPEYHTGTHAIGCVFWTRLKLISIVWFNFYEVQCQANVIYKDKSKNSGSP